MSANSRQVGGDHYQMDIQPWDFIVANNMGYLEGNIVKYVSRWKYKGGVQDLYKARHYLDKLIEVYEDANRPKEAGGDIQTTRPVSDNCCHPYSKGN